MQSSWAVFYEYVNMILAVPNILLYAGKIHFCKQSTPHTWLWLFWWAPLLASSSHALIMAMGVSRKTPLSCIPGTIKQKNSSRNCIQWILRSWNSLWRFFLNSYYSVSTLYLYWKLYKKLEIVDKLDCISFNNAQFLVYSS